MFAILFLAALIGLILFVRAMRPKQISRKMALVPIERLNGKDFINPNSTPRRSRYLRKSEKKGNRSATNRWRQACRLRDHMRISA